MSAKSLFSTSIRVFLSLTLLALVIGIVSVINNNKIVEMPDKAELSRAFDEAVDWHIENREEILEIPNPILWYMLQRAAEKTSDPRIQELFDAYWEKYIKLSRFDPASTLRTWYPMFRVGHTIPVKYESLNGLPDYNKHIVYAIGCNEELGREADIAAQNNPDYCGSFHLFRPTCVTNQLLGIRFLQRSKCGDPDQLAVILDDLQMRVVRELTYDPRVLDVYIKRVMMLLDSGKRELVKPVWVRRILDVQLPDRGWGNFVPLLPVGGGNYLGYGHGDSRIGVPAGEGSLHFKGVDIGKPISTFHATAQVVLMLALMQ